jgi:phosphoglucomutase
MTIATSDRESRDYTRIDAPVTPEQKAKLQKLVPDAIKESDLAGEPIAASVREPISD